MGLIVLHWLLLAWCGRKVVQFRASHLEDWWNQIFLYNKFHRGGPGGGVGVLRTRTARGPRLSWSHGTAPANGPSLQVSPSLHSGPCLLFSSPRRPQMICFCFLSKVLLYFTTHLCNYYILEYMNKRQGPKRVLSQFENSLYVLVNTDELGKC